MWQCFGGHQKILIIFRLNFSWSFFTYELGKPDFFENVHATKTTFGKLALHLVLLQILIFWRLILILSIFVESSPHLPLRLLLSFLLEFTRKSVLWWNKSSLELTDIVNTVTDDGSGKNWIFQAENLEVWFSLCNFTEVTGLKFSLRSLFWVHSLKWCSPCRLKGFM